MSADRISGFHRKVAFRIAIQMQLLLLLLTLYEKAPKKDRRFFVVQSCQLNLMASVQFETHGECQLTGQLTGQPPHEFYS